MEDPVALVIDILAVRRLTRLVVEDDITYSFRESPNLPPSVEYLVHCPMCTSVWAAAAIRLAPRWVRYGLALSEGAIVVGSIWHRIERYTQ